MYIAPVGSGSNNWNFFYKFCNKFEKLWLYKTPALTNVKYLMHTRTPLIELARKWKNRLRKKYGKNIPENLKKGRKSSS